MRLPAPLARPRPEPIASDENVGEYRPLAPSPQKMRWWGVFSVVAALVIGTIARVVMLVGSQGELQSDEAVVGLMAQQLSPGEFHVFYWGQAYGGTLETLPLAPFVDLLDGSRLGLRILPLLESLVLVALCYLLGRRILGRQAALYAACICFVFPLPFLVFSMREMLFYLPITIFGLLILLLAISATDVPSRRGLWIVLGIVAGLGWWTSPQITLFIIPTAGWIVARLRRAVLVPALLAALGAVVGALPWLIYNVRNDWASLDPVAGSGTYLDHIRTFFVDGVPVTLGLRSMVTGKDFVPVAALFVALFGIILVSAFLNKDKKCSLHLWVLLTYPFIFALSPLAWWVGEARYYFYLWPVMALVLADGLRRQWIRAGALGAFAALTLVAILDFTSFPPVRFTNVGPMSQLEKVLDEAKVRYAIAGYWTAYKLAFESDERIVVSSTFGDRRPQWAAEVAAAPRVALVYAKNSVSHATETAALAQQRISALGLTSRAVELKDYVVVFPDGPVSSAQIGADALPPFVS